jgi:hypothetical protein
MQKIAVNRTWVARPAIIRSTPTGLEAKIAASEPPHPIKQRHIKSPRINKEAKSRGLICAKRAPSYCLCSVLIPRYKDEERNVGPRVRPMMYLSNFRLIRDENS